MNQQNYRTPKKIFNLLNEKFGPFKLDATANKEDHLCDEYYEERYSGLNNPWRDVTYCNPPFQKTGLFVKKAFDEWQWRKIRSCLVIPVGCHQRWWQLYGTFASIYYPDSRINFDLPDGTPTNRARGDCMVMVFGAPGLHYLFYTNPFVGRVLYLNKKETDKRFTLNKDSHYYGRIHNQT